jgi:serine/threonine protein kinase
VKLAENVTTKEKVAIKVIDKKNIKGNKQLVSMKREIHLMKFLHHPHIVRALEIFENEREYYIVMEYAPGNQRIVE